MKKFVSILLAGLMLFSAAFCAAEAVDVIGEWYLTGMTMGEETYNAADFGLEMTLTLSEDGSAVLTGNLMDEGDSVGTWSVSGSTLSLTIDGETATAALDGEVLSMASDDGTGLVFEREASMAFTPAEAKAAADISEFNGTWEVTTVGVMGVVVPVSSVMDDLGELGLTSTQIVIDNGKASVMGLTDVREFAFVDGMLRIDVEEPAGVDEGMMDEMVELLEDGSIVYTLMTIAFYCVPVC